MNTHGVSQSGLDVSASEFVPCESVRQQAAKRSVYIELQRKIEPIFSGGTKHFKSQFSEIREVILKLPLAPCVIGELLGDMATIHKDRTIIGFRFFKELRAVLPHSYGHELETGLIGHINNTVANILSNDSINALFSAFCELDETNAADSAFHEEAGDIPRKCDPQVTDKLFAVVSLISLLISRLNLPDNSDTNVCLPPLQPCVNLCQLVAAACRMQSVCRRTGASIEGPDSELAIFTQKNWIGFLYQLFDTLSHSVLFINYLLTDLNSRILDGDWNNCSPLEEHQATNDSSCAGAAELSSQLSSLLSMMRELLLDERLPLKLLRSTVLDILLHSNQLPIVTSSLTSSESYEAGLEGSVQISDEDEVEKCFEEFLKETHQTISFDRS